MPLCVTRKPAERVICILPDGGRITITYDDRQGHTKEIPLVFDAPLDVQIIRGELEGKPRVRVGEARRVASPSSINDAGVQA